MLGRLLAFSTMMGLAMGAVHTVNVGKAGHTFDPRTLSADPGDIISFEFFPLNHSVVKMDPNYPCVPWETYNPDKGQGWWSHFWSVDSVSAKQPTWNVTVNDTNPFYYYCSAPGSCIDYQMVGAVNPPNNSYIDVIAARAAKAPYTMSPGDPFQGDSRVTPTPSATAATTHSSLSVGAIAGIAIGGVAALALIGLLFFFVGRKKKGAEMKETKSSSSPEEGLMGNGHEYPPVYQDPRFSSLTGGTGVAGTGPWENKNMGGNQGNSTQPASGNPNRISELPDSATYDPVEIFTPGPEDMPDHRR